MEAAPGRARARAIRTCARHIWKHHEAWVNARALHLDRHFATPVNQLRKQNGFLHPCEPLNPTSRKQASKQENTIVLGGLMRHLKCGGYKNAQPSTCSTSVGPWPGSQGRLVGKEDSALPGSAARRAAAYRSRSAASISGGGCAATSPTRAGADGGTCEADAASASLAAGAQCAEGGSGGGVCGSGAGGGTELTGEALDMALVDGRSASVGGAPGPSELRRRGELAGEEGCERRLGELAGEGSAREAPRVGCASEGTRSAELSAERCDVARGDERMGEEGCE